MAPGRGISPHTVRELARTWVRVPRVSPLAAYSETGPTTCTYWPGTTEGVPPV